MLPVSLCVMAQPCDLLKCATKGMKTDVYIFMEIQTKTKKNKLHGLSPRANYTDRATVACRRSDCQLLRIKGATRSA
jgi:hypothetical protein